MRRTLVLCQENEQQAKSMCKYEQEKLSIACCRLPIDFPNVQVSDTRDDDSSNTGKSKIKI